MHTVSTSALIQMWSWFIWNYCAETPTFRNESLVTNLAMGSKVWSGCAKGVKALGSQFWRRKVSLYSSSSRSRRNCCSRSFCCQLLRFNLADLSWISCGHIGGHIKTWDGQSTASEEAPDASIMPAWQWAMSFIALVVRSYTVGSEHGWTAFIWTAFMNAFIIWWTWTRTWTRANERQMNGVH